MNRLGRSILVILVVIVAASSGYYLQQKLSSNQAEKIVAKKIIGSSVDNFTLTDTNGQKQQLSDWRGKVVAINFWATWCPPCREEIPHFIELQQHYGQHGLQFIGIALQTADEVNAFLDELAINYPILIGGHDAIYLSRQLGNDIGALPYTVIIDKTGLIAFMHRGALAKATIEPVIQSLL